ncbi:adenine deaminase [Acarospora aff. strigata]|nr:adenine deaminase [Acarospora aff. strigata]
MHLEGSLSPSLLFRLATQNSITLPSSEIDASFSSPESLLHRYTRFTSLDDFLHYYFVAMSVLLKAEDFEALAWEYFLRAKGDGVLHAEVFFDPQAHTGRGVAYGTILEGFKNACRRAELELGMSTLLILCFLRHLPVKSAEETFETAKEDLRKGVLAGIGLDSSEESFPPELFRTVYASAKDAGIRRTAHAGEEGPASYVREAITSLEIQRIDHGFRLAEDEALMAEVARRKMLVTLCPLSNVRLRCVKSVEELPIRKFLDSGVSFSINSDDPAYFGGYILENYCSVQEAFGLTTEEWVGIVRAGIEGSWCGGDRKAELLGQLESVAKQYDSTQNR